MSYLGVKRCYTKPGEKTLATLLLPNIISEVAHPPLIVWRKWWGKLFSWGGVLCFFNVESL